MSQKLKEISERLNRIKAEMCLLQEEIKRTITLDDAITGVEYEVAQITTYARNISEFTRTIRTNREKQEQDSLAREEKGPRHHLKRKEVQIEQK